MVSPFYAPARTARFTRESNVPLRREGGARHDGSFDSLPSPPPSFLLHFASVTGAPKRRDSRRVIVVPRVALRLRRSSVVIRARLGVAVYRAAKSGRN